MKPLRYTLIALAATCGFAYAQTTAYTTPVGYVTEPLAPNAFTFLGLTLHNPTASAGVITGVGANYVDVGTTDWTAILTAGATYILELPNGTIQEITSWNNTGRLTTPEDISGQVVPNTTTYKLRKAATISDIFGANNSAGLAFSADGDTTNADIVYLIGADGSSTGIYYYDDGADAAWYTEGGAEAGNLPIVYSDGFYILRKAGATINLVVTGEVKTQPTSSVMASGWNFMSSVAPVGLTFDNSGLEGYLTPSPDGDYAVVDNVFLPQPDGSFVTVYYYDDGADAAWYTAGGDEAGTLKLEGDFLIFNRGAAGRPVKVAVPAFYSNL